MKKPIKFIQILSRVLIYTSLVCMMASQISHSVFVYMSIGETDQTVYFAYCFSIGFDLSIATFITLGQKTWAYISAGFMLIINLLYYSTPMNLPKVFVIIITAITLSIIMAATITAYSWLMHLDNEAIENEPEKKPYEGKKRGRKPGIKTIQPNLFVNIK